MELQYTNLSRGFRIKLTLLTWLTMIGFDFLLHGGILARWYIKPGSFLLPPERAFLLIPVGYLSFLCLAIMLVWLMMKFNVTGWRQGIIFGLKLGALIWASFTLGLLSISTIESALAIGWFVGQTIELGIAAMAAGIGLENQRLGPLGWKIIIFVIIMIIITVLLQAVGFAPAIVVTS